MKNLTILVLAVLVAASSFVLASKPPARLDQDLVTGGDGPAVQSIGTSDTAQPVSIVNWIIDESGNIKVTNVVRERVIALLPGPFTLTAGTSPWRSDFIPEIGRFNSVQVRFVPRDGLQGLTCYFEWKWADDVIFDDGELIVDRPSPGYPAQGVKKFEVRGPEARIVCGVPENVSPVIEQIWVYLRSE